jgi:DNA-binding protein YbaB
MSRAQTISLVGITDDKINLLVQESHNHAELVVFIRETDLELLSVVQLERIEAVIENRDQETVEDLILDAIWPLNEKIKELEAWKKKHAPRAKKGNKV